MNRQDYYGFVTNAKVDGVRKAHQHGAPRLTVDLRECERVAHDTGDQRINRRSEAVT
jgi:hypothetical protein